MPSSAGLRTSALIARVGMASTALRLALHALVESRHIYTFGRPPPPLLSLPSRRCSRCCEERWTVDTEIRHGEWHRRIGRRLGQMTVRRSSAPDRIGKLVIEHIKDGCARILANDLVRDPELLTPFRMYMDRRGDDLSRCRYHYASTSPSTVSDAGNGSERRELALMIPRREFSSKHGSRRDRR
jgi:hypothetical protein